MKKIFVVTINYNSEDETHHCLESLQKSVKKDFSLSIVVVDNASVTPFVLTQKEKDAKNIITIREEVNLGFTGGNNVGISYALHHNANYILLINNDTKVDPNMIQILLEELEKNSTVGVCVPKIYFAKGHEFHSERYKKEELGHVLWFAGGDIDWKNGVSFHRGVDEVDHGQYDTTGAIGFATGCCMLLKKEIFEKIGLFDDRYFLYFEDADMCERIKRAGVFIYYVPKAFMWHITAASGGGSGSTLHDYFLTRNKMIFGMKYGPLRLRIALIKESMRLLLRGRGWQKRGILDFYLHNFREGSWK